MCSPNKHILKSVKEHVKTPFSKIKDNSCDATPAVDKDIGDGNEENILPKSASKLGDMIQNPKELHFGGDYIQTHEECKPVNMDHLTKSCGKSPLKIIEEGVMEEKEKTEGEMTSGERQQESQKEKTEGEMTSGEIQQESQKEKTEEKVSECVPEPVDTNPTEENKTEMKSEEKNELEPVPESVPQIQPIEETAEDQKEN
jgi:hypothetical protein